MKIIDANPTEYRSYRNGKWRQNIDKPFCRRMAFLGLSFMAFIAAREWMIGSNPYAVPFGTIMGMAIGAMIILSLKSTDW